eukprot:3150921-Pleurochrysis_carterae.AAC.1
MLVAKPQNACARLCADNLRATENARASVSRRSRLTDSARDCDARETLIVLNGCKTLNAGDCRL